MQLLVGRFKDFESEYNLARITCADERTHVRKGQGIIKCLVSLGAFKKDMDVFTVSREDLEDLVGE